MNQTMMEQLRDNFWETWRLQEKNCSLFEQLTPGQKDEMFKWRGKVANEALKDISKIFDSSLTGWHPQSSPEPTGAPTSPSPPAPLPLPIPEGEIASQSDTGGLSPIQTDEEPLVGKGALSDSEGWGKVDLALAYEGARRAFAIEGKRGQAWYLAKQVSRIVGGCSEEELRSWLDDPTNQ